MNSKNKIKIKKKCQTKRNKKEVVNKEDTQNHLEDV